MGKLFYLAIIGLTLTGCAGRIEIQPPTNTGHIDNTRLVSANKETVWSKLIPGLSREFFVVNTLDKSSGLISVSYSGDPERFIDCGRLISYLKNARGERTYDFPAARAVMNYEVMDGNGLFYINRRMEVEGRANIVVEPISTQQTRVTINTRYVLTRRISAAGPGGQGTLEPSVLTFNTGQTASFSPDRDGRTVTCVSNGSFERNLLALAG